MLQKAFEDLIQGNKTNESVICEITVTIGPHEHLLAVVKWRKMAWTMERKAKDQLARQTTGDRTDGRNNSQGLS